MRIKFKAPDPRAGTVAQMDSHRGQQLIDTGAAVLVKDEESEAAAAGVVAASIATPATTSIPARKTAAKKR